MSIEKAIPVIVVTLWCTGLALYLDAIVRMDNYVGRLFREDRDAARKLRWHSQVEIWTLGWRKPWMIVSDGVSLYRDNMRALREPSSDANFERLRNRAALRVRLLFALFAFFAVAALLVGVGSSLRAAGAH